MSLCTGAQCQTSSRTVPASFCASARPRAVLRPRDTTSKCEHGRCLSETFQRFLYMRDRNNGQGPSHQPVPIPILIHPLSLPCSKWHSSSVPPPRVTLPTASPISSLVRMVEPSIWCVSLHYRPLLSLTCAVCARAQDTYHDSRLGCRGTCHLVTW